MNLEQQKSTLQDLKHELLDRVSRTHKHIHEREERVSGNFSDQSQEMENQELVYNLDQEGRNELKAIEQALHRIDSGEFGFCQSCGTKIQEARIQAIPYAEYCIECATTEEA
jgi:DnaK suppressor protein|tara:strand:+ start:229 stop:564 length:336 start_codon:yes stop_codon:yes gene_type:complete